MSVITIDKVKETFNKPSAGLVDFGIHKGDSVYQGWGHPCHWRLMSYLSESKGEGVYLGLRLPSKYATGMDVEDDINRETDKQTYAWTFEKQGTGNATKEDDEWALKYWKFIFDRRYSPWRSAIPEPVKFIENDAGEVVAAYLKVDPEAESQTFLSLCMASRLPWQSLGHLRVYRDMINAGFKRYESLFTAVQLRYLRDNKTLGFRVVAGHFPFAAHNTEIAIEWLKAGTPHCDGQKVKNSSRSGYVDHIWDRQKRQAQKEYQQVEGRSIKDAVLYKILAVDSEYKGTFGAAFKNTTGGTQIKGATAGTWDDVLPKLKETRSQWSV